MQIKIYIVYTVKTQHTPELLSAPTEEVPLLLSFVPVFQQPPPLKSTQINTVSKKASNIIYALETGFKIIEVMVERVFNQQPCSCTDYKVEWVLL